MMHKELAMTLMWILKKQHLKTVSHHQSWGGAILCGVIPLDSVQCKWHHIVKNPEGSTYSPAVELRYLCEMVKLDQVELAAIYQCMELTLVGADVGDRIKHTSELNVLNYKNSMQSFDAEEWCREIRNKESAM